MDGQATPFPEPQRPRTQFHKAVQPVGEFKGLRPGAGHKPLVIQGVLQVEGHPAASIRDRAPPPNRPSIAIASTRSAQQRPVNLPAAGLRILPLQSLDQE